MKHLLILPLFLMALKAQSQQVFSLESLTRDSIEVIESHFTSAYDSRPDQKSVFPDAGETVLQNWETLHTSLGEYLGKQNVHFPVDVKVFLRFYFEKTGAVDYVGYLMRVPLDADDKSVFEKHLVEFSKKANFGMRGSSPYVQCGTVVFKKSKQE